MVLYHSLPDADGRTRERLESLLTDGESLAVAAHRLEWFQRKFDSGLLRSLADKMDSRERIALTDDRIIKFGAGANRQSESHQLDNVSSVEHKRNKVTIEGSGFDVSFRFNSLDHAEEFATEVRTTIN